MQQNEVSCEGKSSVDVSVGVHFLRIAYPFPLYDLTAGVVRIP